MTHSAHTTHSSFVAQLNDVLQHIDDLAIQTYKRQTPVLIDTVTTTMHQRKDIHSLIGKNGQYPAHDTLIYHPWTLIPQIQLKSANAIIRSLIWVYQLCNHRGVSLSYFPIEMAAWQQAVEQHLEEPANHHIAAFYQVIVDHHAELVMLSQREEDKPVKVDSYLMDYFTEYLDALLASDTRRAIDVSRTYVKTTHDIPVWWEKIILPSMYEIGRLWSNGRITVGQEHIATSITQRVMSLYYPMILNLPREKGGVIVTVSPDELHEIGARMLADLLEMNGWDVYYTGANTPSESLERLLCQQGARYLCISTTLTCHLPHVKHTVQYIKRANPEVTVVVGGQAYLADDQIWQNVGADAFVSSASQAVSYLQAAPTIGQAKMTAGWGGRRHSSLP